MASWYALQVRYFSAVAKLRRAGKDAEANRAALRFTAVWKRKLVLKMFTEKQLVAPNGTGM